MLKTMSPATALLAPLTCEKGKKKKLSKAWYDFKHTDPKSKDIVFSNEIILKDETGKNGHDALQVFKASRARHHLIESYRCPLTIQVRGILMYY